MSDPVTLALAEILGLPAHSAKCVLTLEAGRFPQAVVTYMPKPPERIEQRFELVPVGPATAAPLDLDRLEVDARARLARDLRESLGKHRYEHHQLYADIVWARVDRAEQSA